ncbi:TetR/AcrR family transcriptional regulator [Paenibacillus athensensis]|uniref:TetR family transcriptional regulator n=1 Tax=Paenibacillus athensensis TaxID=1967502 RepID=A0A4Y8Q6S2_9BACL|nr:TetR/AcrR family transcriptional regulator [Paenibacillus athensensis]MCD1259462.1 TetR/AcrR family transcriptional regulator [Paenibacillus athensensis]
MARKAVAQELSRERILEESRELFYQHGYRSLTMRSIAKAMGYSHGALYYHFKEKAELFYALIKDDFSILLKRQREMVQREEQYSVNLLQKLMLEFIWFGLNNPNHYEMMFMIQEPELLRYSRTEQAQCLDLFAAVLKCVLKDQEELAENKYMLPWNVFMSLHGFISYSIHFKISYEEVRKLAEEHVRLICRSLGLTAADSPRPPLVSGTGPAAVSL